MSKGIHGIPPPPPVPGFLVEFMKQYELTGELPATRSIKLGQETITVTGEECLTIARAFIDATDAWHEGNVEKFMSASRVITGI